MRTQNISSCTSEKCPYHYHFVDGEIKEYPSETVMVQKISYFLAPSSNQMQIGLDTPSAISDNLSNSETIVSSTS